MPDSRGGLTFHQLGSRDLCSTHPPNYFDTARSASKFPLHIPIGIFPWVHRPSKARYWEILRMVLFTVWTLTCIRSSKSSFLCPSICQTVTKIILPREWISDGSQCSKKWGFSSFSRAFFIGFPWYFTYYDSWALLVLVKVKVLKMWGHRGTEEEFYVDFKLWVFVSFIPSVSCSLPIFENKTCLQRFSKMCQNWV